MTAQKFDFYVLACWKTTVFVCQSRLILLKFDIWLDFNKLLFTALFFKRNTHSLFRTPTETELKLLFL
jgi:hypothetical protein